MIRILQLIDSLEAGGAERLSVSFANVLTDKTDGSFLCTTRAEGILKKTINESVGYLFLKKQSRFDLKAIFRLKKFIKQNGISIIHAHSTSFFLACLVKLIYPKVKLVWHDHYGYSEYLNKRPKLVLRLSSLLFSHIFTVNHLLLDWVRKNLNCKSTSYLRNFMALSQSEPVTHLKGNPGKRILCLANLRPQKDHITLFKAFKDINQKHSDWSLHCVGKDFKDSYSTKLNEYVKDNRLSDSIHFYGSCPDISHILVQSTIGVLSSKSEGLPISLLEYGFGKLAVVATGVGDCALVVDSPKKGTIVQPNDPKAMSNAIKNYIENKSERVLVSENLYNDIQESFSEDAVISEILKVYREL